MSDIRKRTGRKGVTYQVRFGTPAGYEYRTFDTLKEAREFREDSKAKKRAGRRSSEIVTVAQAVDKWLDICSTEGRDGRDPVTAGTRTIYEYRADLMKAYKWPGDLAALDAPDVIEFRSWLLKNYGRDQARRTLSSFHAVMKEMSTRGIIASNVAAGISIRKDSRYTEPVVIPTLGEVMSLLRAADELANSKNKQTAKTWERYRPMLYLAADSGMRPQEHLVIAGANVLETGVAVDRAIEFPGSRLSAPKSAAGRRFIDLSPDTLDMIRFYRDKKAVKNDHDLVFPTSTGHWQSINSWRRRCFYEACEHAGLTEKVEVDGEMVDRPKYSPYDLRHFYASVLIAQRTNLKRLQKLMGHEDVALTLNVYGHLIDEEQLGREERPGMLASLVPNPSASVPSATGGGGQEEAFASVP